jgi:hypothetical protein
MIPVSSSDHVVDITVDWPDLSLPVDPSRRVEAHRVWILSSPIEQCVNLCLDLFRSDENWMRSAVKHHLRLASTSLQLRNQGSFRTFLSKGHVHSWAAGWRSP